jgi:hypothetical protein
MGKWNNEPQTVSEKAVMPFDEIISRHFSQGIEENYEDAHSECSVSGTGCEPNT